MKFTLNKCRQSILGIALLLTSACHAQIQSTEYLVRPGVVHRYEFDPAGPWKIHVLTIDLHRHDLSITTARAHGTVFGREKTSEMVRDWHDTTSSVVAAMNADFFELPTGESTHNQISSGEVIKARVPGADRHRNRSQFAMTHSGHPWIDRFAFSGLLIMDDSSFSVGGVNSIADSCTVFTSRYNSTIPAPEGMRNTPVLLTEQARVAGDTLVEIITGIEPLRDSMFVPEGKTVIAFYRAVRFSGSPGDTVRLVLHFAPAANGLAELVGGFPQIVRNGMNAVHQADSIEGPLNSKFADVRHPRTGIGYTARGDTLIWMTSDGRQESGAGMTLDEFADLMIAHGIWQGLNLDGGGSTTLVIDGQVVNSPSDEEGERPVANTILLLSHPRH